MAPHLSRAFPVARVVYGQVALVNESGKVLDSFGRPWLEMRPAFMARETLNIHQATFHHRSLFDARGKFDESFRIASDCDLLLRELRYGQVEFVPRLVAAIQHSGMSSNPVSKVKSVAIIMRARRINASKSTGGLRLAWVRAMDPCPAASRDR